VSYGRGSYTTDSLPPDEKSLNISELEASESMLGDEISFEQRSFHSDENLDLPELVDDSYMISSEASKDLHTEHGRDSITDHSDYADSRISHQEHRESELSEYGCDIDQSFIPSNYTRPDLNLDLGLLNQESDDLTASGNDEKTVLERLDTVPPMVQRHTFEPNIEGDSLFTQEEPLPVVGGHSLVEFEELEAVVHTHLDDPAMDNLDLIGAYLQGLEEQEADEDSGNNSDGNLRYSSHDPDQLSQEG
jgi:hypothetical protein